MTEKMLTVRMSEQEHRTLKLYAVLQGRSVNSVVLELIRAELTKNAPATAGLSREQFVADLFDRLGVDPASPEHRAAAARADASIQRGAGDQAGDSAKRGKGERGAA